MSTRRRAREIALQVLYEDDLNPDQDVELAESFIATRLHSNKPLVTFAKSLWQSVLKNRWEIDKALSAKATNWSLRRMAAIDRNILRMATYEILFTDTPGRVVINEAVELAKRYGNHQSGQFVNGILDRILNASPEDAEASAENPTEAEAGDGAATDVDNSSEPEALASNE
ncbi:MAG: transcription antitermination factor NusB [Planctomycetota bacterium]